MEDEYAAAIRRLLTEQLTLSTVKENDPSLTSFLLGLISESLPFQRTAEVLARRMVTGVVVNNAKSWKAAAAESTQGRRIYELLQKELAQGAGSRARKLVEENAQLIRRVPLDMAQRATEIAASAQQQGLRASAIVAHIRKVLPDIAESRARLIARTEVGKAETAVTQARAERLGLPAYRWRTAEDGRVRKSHKNLDGVVVFWDEPPSPEKLVGERSTLGAYAPAGAPNCRCIALPIVSLDAVSWPARVYRNGSIERMSRSQFRNLSVGVAA